MRQSEDRTYQGAFASDDVFIALWFQIPCDSNPVSSGKASEASAPPTNLFPVASGCAMVFSLFYEHRLPEACRLGHGSPSVTIHPKQ